MKTLLLFGIIALFCFSIVSAQEGTGDETSGRKAWWFFEQQPLPQVTNLTLMELAFIIGIVYFFWKYKKK